MKDRKNMRDSTLISKLRMINNNWRKQNVSPDLV